MVTPNNITWQEALVIVEKLSWSDKLRLISELLASMQVIVTETEPIDLLTLAGVGEEVWAKVDTDAYLDQERDTW